MSTRMTSMSITYRAKQKLFQLLFKSDDKNIMHTSSLKSNSSSSSLKHSKLRSEYLKRIQEIHPDKLSSSNENGINSLKNKESIHSRFIELQSAWKEYEKLFKLTRSNNKNNDEVEEDDLNNFTMFGVGCSFSDTPEERENRWKITDEACRGWFTSGLISERNIPIYGNKPISSFKSGKSTSLIDNDMFTEEKDDSNVECSANIRDKKHGAGRGRKFLLDLPKFKRKNDI